MAVAAHVAQLELLPLAVDPFAGRRWLGVPRCRFRPLRRSAVAVAGEAAAWDAVAAAAAAAGAASRPFRTTTTTTTTLTGRLLGLNLKRME